MIEVRVKVIFLQELHNHFSLTNTDLFFIGTFEVKRLKTKKNHFSVKMWFKLKGGNYEYSIW